MSKTDKQRHGNISTLCGNREATTRSSTRGWQWFGGPWGAEQGRGQDGKGDGEADCRKPVLLLNLLLLLIDLKYKNCAHITLIKIFKNSETQSIKFTCEQGTRSSNTAPGAWREVWFFRLCPALGFLQAAAGPRAWEQLSPRRCRRLLGGRARETLSPTD